MPPAFRITVLLLLVSLNMAVTEMPGFVFQPQGAVVQIGSCFGADNMVVFKLSGTGDQLLVNYSAGGGVSYFPEDLQGRANITDYNSTLGLLVGHLDPGDNGIYRTECWQNETLVSHLRQQLVVCREKVEFGEMTELEDDWAEVQCDGSVGAGTTIHWYYDPYTNYSLRAGAVSLDPLLARGRGAVEVRDGGALLRVSNSVRQDSFSFYCAVMEGPNCLSFQTIYLPRYVDVRTIYASHGDRVALACSSEYKSPSWETPLGKINTTTKSPKSREGSAQGGHMYISRDAESKSHFLIIPAVSDEHAGQYSCFSPSLERVYLIAFCPRMESREISVVEGGNISLECDVHQKTPADSTGVEWHRDRASGDDSLIRNATDEAAARPGDPRRGEVLSEDGFSLKLSGLRAEDAGVYWCVVTTWKQSLQSETDTRDYDYVEEEEDDEEEDEEEDYNDYANVWLDVCTSKQEIVLTVASAAIKVDGRGLDTTPKDFANDPRNDSSPAPDPGVPGYALGLGLATGSLLVGVIGTVAAMKTRSKDCFKRGCVTTDTGSNFYQGTEMARDPGCTEMLAPNDPC